MLKHLQFKRSAITTLITSLLFAFPQISFAAGDVHLLDLTSHWVGYASLVIFVLAYILVIAEEEIHMRKSKPVMVAAGIIWAMIAAIYAQQADSAFHHTAEIMIRHNLLEYAELLLFLLAAMTYINTMGERGVFDALRSWLVNQGFTLRTIFWLTGILAFFISPIADNLTTALLMATVAMAVGGDNHKFVAIACINIVVAANAGGAFSPFGDITTLMVWQKGIVDFQQFFVLFVPSVVNWIIPAALMSMAVSNERPKALNETASMKAGALVVVALFLVTITFLIVLVSFNASSTIDLRSITLPRRKLPSAVKSTLALASLIRSASALALKPAYTTECIAPILAQANMAIALSGIFGIYIATLSPFLTPSPLSALTSLLTS